MRIRLRKTAELGEGQLLGNLGITKETKAKLPASSGEMIPDHYEARLIEEEDRIQICSISILSVSIL